jgi:hypothetical protein
MPWDDVFAKGIEKAQSLGAGGRTREGKKVPPRGKEVRAGKKKSTFLTHP